MAKIRTKKEKIIAKQHRTNNPVAKQSDAIVQVNQVSLPSLPVKIVSAANNHEIDTTTLLGYPIKLLYRDLARSIAITLVLVVLLLGIFVFFRYN